MHMDEYIGLPEDHKSGFGNFWTERSSMTFPLRLCITYMTAKPMPNNFRLLF